VNLLEYGFMVRALLGALFTGLSAPAVGTYLVQRRLSLMGDGVGHIAVTGVALGLLTGTSPTLTAVLVAIVGGVVIELIRAGGRTSGDVALALLFYGGIAGGVLLTGLAGQSAATLNTYLFGSITTISPADVWVTVGLAVVVVVLAVGLAPQLFAVAQDQEFARVAGLPVRSYNVLVSVMAAVTVTVAMRTVGLLLVSALMVVPVAACQQLARSFRTTLLSAMGLGLVVSVAGVVVSASVTVGEDAQGIAPGPTIVLLALACFLAAYPVGVWLRRRQRLHLPFAEPAAGYRLAAGHTAVPEQHQHRHGDDCGHPAVPHGDHVDYVHDGHRHAQHGGHYDEH
jgi:zinc transport system permease protein